MPPPNRPVIMIIDDDATVRLLNDQLREVKVVIISSAEIIPPRVQELAQAIIRKPFDIDTLVENIQRLAPPPEPPHSKETTA